MTKVDRWREAFGNQTETVYCRRKRFAVLGKVFSFPFCTKGERAKCYHVEKGGKLTLIKHNYIYKYTATLKYIQSQNAGSYLIAINGQTPLSSPYAPPRPQHAPRQRYHRGEIGRSESGLLPRPPDATFHGQEACLLLLFGITVRCSYVSESDKSVDNIPIHITPF